MGNILSVRQSFRYLWPIYCPLRDQIRSELGMDKKAVNYVEKDQPQLASMWDKRRRGYTARLWLDRPSGTPTKYILSVLFPCAVGKTVIEKIRLR